MMSNGWSIYVIALVVLNILAMVWLLIATSKSNDIDAADTTGHKWDGIEELNNPLPRWWLGLFISTIIFAGIYLYLYPGLGNYQGSLGWSQTSQYEDAMLANRAKQNAFFAEFVDLDIPALAVNDKAMGTAERLFLNNCATCHGSDAHGAKGFPNLTDDDWLYGNNPETVLQTITNGRAGVMPDLGLSEANISVLAYYVQGLSGVKVTDFAREKGAALFAVCAACHGPEGQGNQQLGAPNLSDNIWLHGASTAEISAIIRDGKQGNMPSFSTLLSANERKLLAAYVLSLGQE